MKTKGLNNKLALNKETVADLEKNEMNTAIGRGTGPFQYNTDDLGCTDLKWCEFSKPIFCSPPFAE